MTSFAQLGNANVADLPLVSGVTSTLLDETSWLRDFELRRGRKLRVLHVGNVANNAYLAAKLLRRVGIEADVLSRDYYHVMATPEWEEIALRHDHGDDYLPRFSTEDLRGYERPRWFVQGPVAQCVAYLFARLHGDQAEADRLWTRLGSPIADAATSPLDGDDNEASISIVSLRRRAWSASLRFVSEPRLIPYKVARLGWHSLLTMLRVSGQGRAANQLIQVVGNALAYFRVYLRRSNRSPELGVVRTLIAEYAALFPSRPDKLSIADVMLYAEFIQPLKPVFAQYDIIQAYGIDPILPLVCGKRPYVAFEHGTLREFIRGDNPVHRLNALAYRKAGHVFVTNGDCLQHAKWLGIDDFSATIHPTDIDQHEARDEDEIVRIRRRHNAEVILFCPVRHDWAVKGVDVHLRALPLILKRLHRRVVLLLIPWGLQVNDSKRLVAELGCEDAVVWLERSLCRPILVSHMQAADVVLDQMALPHFGGTAPQALAAGTPVIMSYRPESTAWLVDEPAPILSAFTPNEVADSVVRALDPVWLAQFRSRARAWVHSQHHQDRFLRDHLRVYQRLLENEP